MRTIAVLPSCFLFMFVSVSLGAAFPLQTPAPKAAATPQKESCSARAPATPSGLWVDRVLLPADQHPRIGYHAIHLQQRRRCKKPQGNALRAQLCASSSINHSRKSP
jgi:hypothetical protein